MAGSEPCCACRARSSSATSPLTARCCCRTTSAGAVPPALPRGATRERDLSWLDWTQPVALTEDGTTLLMTEEGEGGGPGYGVYLRKLDGSPAVRLGDGQRRWRCPPTASG